MAENEPPDHPADYLPAMPALRPPPVPSPDLTADEYRLFQEFQRFRYYQHFIEQGGVPQGGGPPGVVTPYGGPRPHGTASGAPPAHHDLAKQLAGVREQLTDLAATQATINQTINPPLWRRLLRSRLVSRLLSLCVIVIVVIVGTPLLINNLVGDVFGDHTNLDDPNVVARSLPPPKEESRTLSSGPYDAVYYTYSLIAQNRPAATCYGFSLAAQIEFANAVGAPNCQTAVTTLHRQVTDPATYGDPNLRDLPESKGSTDTISSCDFTVSGGPRLGTFTLTDYEGWEITDYVPPAACPKPTAPNN